MFWKFKRRFRIGMLRSGFYYCCVVICLILVMNLLALKLNFETIEGENYIDAGGTTLPSERKLQNIDVHYPFFNDLNPNMFVSRQGLRHTYENRLRKLLEIMETNLDNSAAKIVTEKTLPYEAYFPERLLYCDDVMNITDMTYMASGWTKAVFKGTFKGRQVAVKTVDVNGQDVTTCRDAGRSETDCYVKAAKKIVKEIVVLQALANDNVLKVLGFCLPRDADDNLYVAMVTELGESVDLIKLLQMSWEDRLR
ncbi:PKDCC-like protein, partial [Mya arenaria]